MRSYISLLCLLSGPSGLWVRNCAERPTRSIVLVSGWERCS